MDEEIFQDRLGSLLDDSGEDLQAQVIWPLSCERNPPKTGAVISAGRVVLTLNTSDVDKWTEALNIAEDLVIRVRQKRDWELTNPVFAERIQALVNQKSSNKGYVHG